MTCKLTNTEMPTGTRTQRDGDRYIVNTARLGGTQGRRRKMTRSIAQIDKDIDANTRSVLAVESITTARCNKMTAHDWQGLRDRNPAFDQRDHKLFRERGIAQLVRDAKAVKDKRLRTRYLKDIAAKYGMSVEG